jgi:hypothetical protein
MQMMLEAGQKKISAPSPAPSRTLKAVLETGVVTGDQNMEVQPKGAF